MESQLSFCSEILSKKSVLISNNGKVKRLRFKVNIDKNGSESSGEKARVSSEASLYQEPKHLQRYALHPKSLITLLANPNYSWLTFLNKIQFNSLITWMNNLYPSFTAATFQSLVYSAKKIDALEIKKQLKNNGFKFIPKNIAMPGSESLIQERSDPASY